MKQSVNIGQLRPEDEVEFYTFNDELWARTSAGVSEKLTEQHTDLVNLLFERMQSFYTEAFSALCAFYEKAKLNVPYFRFRVVSRFLRCNFSAIDDRPDFKDGMFADFEYVQCPLRGECKLEGIVCRPTFNHHLSPAEERVARLWYQEGSKEAIGEQLYISPMTVHRHVTDIYAKLGVHTRSEFVKYAERNNMFR